MKRAIEPYNPPWIVSHRGAMDEAPENTFSAFEAALAYPIDGIEMDVQMTRDDVLVIFHDRDLSRVVGESGAISGFTYVELSRFDWGMWYAEDFRGERLPTLKQTLDLLAHKTRLLISIKSFDGDRRSGRSLEITTHVLQTLREHVPAGREDNVFVLSFDPQVLRHASQQGGPWKYVLNSVNPQSHASEKQEPTEHLFAHCAAIERLDRNVTRLWHADGKRVMTYSCNTASDVARAIDLECDVIMTDKPGWIVDYLKSESSDK